MKDNADKRKFILHTNNIDNERFTKTFKPLKVSSQRMIFLDYSYSSNDHYFCTITPYLVHINSLLIAKSPLNGINSFQTES